MLCSPEATNTSWSFNVPRRAAASSGVREAMTKAGSSLGLRLLGMGTRGAMIGPRKVPSFFRLSKYAMNSLA